MDNCIRCGDPATTTTNLALDGGLATNSTRYCNPCSIEVAKLAAPGVQCVFDRVLDAAEIRAIYESHDPGMLYLAPGSVSVVCAEPEEWAGNAPCLHIVGNPDGTATATPLDGLPYTLEQLPGGGFRID